MAKLMTFLATILAEAEVTTDTVRQAADSVGGLSTQIRENGVVVVSCALFMITTIAFVIVAIRLNKKTIDKTLQEHDNMLTSSLKQNEEDRSQDHKYLESFLSATLDKYVADLKPQQQDPTIIANAITAALEPLRTTLATINDNTKPTPDDYHNNIVGAYIDINTALKTASSTLIKKIDFDRVAVYVFHNGNTSFHGLPFFKMSCVYEQTNNGRGTIRGKEHIDLPLHLFNDFIAVLEKDGEFKAQNVQAAGENNDSLREFVAYSDTKSIIIRGIKDDSNSLMGFVCAESNEADTFETDEKRNRELSDAVTIMADEIRPIVINKYVYKKLK